MRTKPVEMQNVVNFATSKPKRRVAVPNDEIIIELNRHHARLMRRGHAAAAQESTGLTLKGGGSDALYAAAEAIFNSLTAFPAQSLAGLKAKVGIMRREWPDDDGRGTLGETHRGFGPDRGNNDVIASILDDMRRLL